MLDFFLYLQRTCTILAPVPASYLHRTCIVPAPYLHSTCPPASQLPGNLAGRLAGCVRDGQLAGWLARRFWFRLWGRFRFRFRSGSGSSSSSRRLAGWLAGPFWFRLPVLVPVLYLHRTCTIPAQYLHRTCTVTLAVPGTACWLAGWLAGSGSGSGADFGSDSGPVPVPVPVLTGSLAG